MTTQNLEALMAEYQDLKDQTARAKTRMDEIKALLGEHLPEGGTIGDHKVSIVRGRASWPKVAKAYPMNDFPQLYRQEIVLDQDKAQIMIAPAQLDEYRGAPSVSIR